MGSMSKPPPVIDSARTLFFAVVDDDVMYTDRINLIVGGERLGRVECLAICENYCVPNDILLLFCDSEWLSKGVIAGSTVDEVKARAEIGYRGISAKWQKLDASQVDIDRFLREVYEVDPATEWWRMECSFCGKEGERIIGTTRGNKARICDACITVFYEMITNENRGDG
jgi:ClpX C4-type zinc finger